MKLLTPPLVSTYLLSIFLLTVSTPTTVAMDVKISDDRRTLSFVGNSKTCKKNEECKPVKLLHELTCHTTWVKTDKGYTCASGPVRHHFSTIDDK